MPGHSVQGGAPEEDRCCEDGLAEGQARATRYVENRIGSCLLDASSSSHGPCSGCPTATKASEHTARVLAFNNLGDDSSPDVHETPLPQESKEERLPPPPLMPS
jgi:hypothetical protein